MLTIQCERANFKLPNQHFPLRGLVLLARMALFSDESIRELMAQGLVCSGHFGKAGWLGKQTSFNSIPGVIDDKLCERRTNCPFIQ